MWLNKSISYKHVLSCRGYSPRHLHARADSYLDHPIPIFDCPSLFPLLPLPWIPQVLPFFCVIPAPTFRPSPTARRPPIVICFLSVQTGPRCQQPPSLHMNPAVPLPNLLTLSPSPAPTSSRASTTHATNRVLTPPPGSLPNNKNADELKTAEGSPLDLHPCLRFQVYGDIFVKYPAAMYIHFGPRVCIGGPCHHPIALPGLLSLLRALPALYLP